MEKLGVWGGGVCCTIQMFDSGCGVCMTRDVYLECKTSSWKEGVITIHIVFWYVLLPAAHIFACAEARHIFASWYILSLATILYSRYIAILQNILSPNLIHGKERREQHNYMYKYFCRVYLAVVKCEFGNFMVFQYRFLMEAVVTILSVSINDYMNK